MSIIETQQSNENSLTTKSPFIITSDTQERYKSVENYTMSVPNATSQTLYWNEDEDSPGNTDNHITRIDDPTNELDEFELQNSPTHQPQHHSHLQPNSDTPLQKKQRRMSFLEFN